MLTVTIIMTFLFKLAVIIQALHQVFTIFS